MKQTNRQNVEQVQNKCFLILVPDTVAYPRAVMVHPQNALVALSTMMAFRWFLALARRALF
jgi:hypothetical protein